MKMFENQKITGRNQIACPYPFILFLLLIFNEKKPGESFFN